MWDLVVFSLAAALLTVLLIAALKTIWRPTGSKKISTIPGLNPSKTEDGNLSDISRAGSLHEFLVGLHGRFGPMAGFWWGETYTISIASPQLFKEHQHVFDRPGELFMAFQPLFRPQSIQYANGEDGQTRRRNYDRAFGHQLLPRYSQSFQKVANSILQTWLETGPEEHVPLTKYTERYAIKCAHRALLGVKLEDDFFVTKFKTAYDRAMAEMEHRLSDPALPGEDSAREKLFKDAVNCMHSVVREAVKSREERSQYKQGNKLIDLIMETCPDEETIWADATTYVIGGFHTTSNALSWGLYYLAGHKDVQDKLYQEIMDVLGDEDTINENNFSDFKYLMQVIKETLRCAVVAPWGARVLDVDCQLGGHKITKNTPVVHALGVVLQDKELWPSPQKFDPDRFSEANISKKSPFAFSPFGFAGKRVCPGYKFAYWESAVLITTLIRRFEIRLWNDHVVTPAYGFVTHPSEEIWIKLIKRS